MLLSTSLAARCSVLYTLNNDFTELPVSLLSAKIETIPSEAWEPLCAVAFGESCNRYCSFFDGRGQVYSADWIITSCFTADCGHSPN
jgi:hypothetical protein